MCVCVCVCVCVFNLTRKATYKPYINLVAYCPFNAAGQGFRQ